MIYIWLIIAVNVGFIAGAWWRGSRAVGENNQMRKDVMKMVKQFGEIK